MIDLSQRHQATRDIMRWFRSDHLPEHLVSAPRQAGDLAENMILSLPDSAELTAGLRLLVQAKDCFVRAAVAAHEDSS